MTSIHIDKRKELMHIITQMYVLKRDIEWYINYRDQDYDSQDGPTRLGYVKSQLEVLLERFKSLY